MDLLKFQLWVTLRTPVSPRVEYEAKVTVARAATDHSTSLMHANRASVAVASPRSAMAGTSGVDHS